MEALLNTIVAWVTAFFNYLADLAIDLLVIVINLVLGLVAFLIKLLSTLMPSLSIGTDLIDQFPTPQTAICWINWIFPVDVLLQCVQFYVTVYLLKFAINPFLKKLGLIG